MSLPRKRIAVPLDTDGVVDKPHPRKGKRPPNAPNGRKAGVPNKLTRLMKDAVSGAMEALGDLSARGKRKGTGGTEGYLTHIARKHPGVFMSFAGRFVPYEFKGSGVTSKTLILQVGDIDTLKKYRPDQLELIKSALEGKLIESLPNANPDDYAKTLEN